jgi:hypothetical protein
MDVLHLQYLLFQFISRFLDLFYGGLSFLLPRFVRLLRLQEAADKCCLCSQIVYNVCTKLVHFFELLFYVLLAVEDLLAPASQELKASRQGSVSPLHRMQELLPQISNPGFRVLCQGLKLVIAVWRWQKVV